MQRRRKNKYVNYIFYKSTVINKIHDFSCRFYFSYLQNFVFTNRTPPPRDHMVNLRILIWEHCRCRHHDHDDAVSAGWVRGPSDLVEEAPLIRFKFLRIGYFRAWRRRMDSPRSTPWIRYRRDLPHSADWREPDLGARNGVNQQDVGLLVGGGKLAVGGSHDVAPRPSKGRGSTATIREAAQRGLAHGSVVVGAGVED
jgi:hypothetical protein